jgi:hypothetical protein
VPAGRLQELEKRGWYFVVLNVVSAPPASALIAGEEPKVLRRQQSEGPPVAVVLGVSRSTIENDLSNLH